MFTAKGGRIEFLICFKINWLHYRMEHHYLQPIVSCARWLYEAKYEDRFSSL